MSLTMGHGESLFVDSFACLLVHLFFVFPLEPRGQEFSPLLSTAVFQSLSYTERFAL